MEDILNVDDCPAKDRLWVALRLVPHKVQVLFACSTAVRALSHIKNPDPRSLRAIKVTRAFIAGTASRQELEEARKAAATAWAATAWAAAWGAAVAEVAVAEVAVAEVAAAEAAEVVAEAASWEAAEAASWGAAEAEREEQIKCLKKLIKESEEGI